MREGFVFFAVVVGLGDGGGGHVADLFGQVGGKADGHGFAGSDFDLLGELAVHGEPVVVGIDVNGDGGGSS